MILTFELVTKTYIKNITERMIYKYQAPNAAEQTAFL